MDRFTRLDRYLGSPLDNDYWSDVGVEDAEEIIEEFQESDWRPLEQACHDRPVQWMQRLVTVLPGAAPVHGAALFRNIITTCNEAVLPAAVDALRRLDEPTLRSALDEKGAARLRVFAESYPRKDTIEEILVRAGCATPE